MIRMTLRGTFVLAFAFTLSAASWAAYTGAEDALLEAEDRADLPEPAREPYDMALKAYDHVDRDSGVLYLEQAAKAAPEFIPIQFILASRARDRARFYYGVKALEYYDKAEEAVQRVQMQTNLSLEEKRHADQLLQTIRTEREMASSKDKKMEETGFQAIVIPLAVQRAKARGLEVTPDQISAALGKKTPGATAEAAGGAAPAAAGATSPAAAGQYPVAGAGLPLASYGIATDKPAAPPPGQPGFQPFPNAMGFPSGMPPGMSYGPDGQPNI